MVSQYINERGSNMPRKKKTEDEKTISGEKKVKEKAKNTKSSIYGWNSVKEKAKFTIK